MLQFVSTIEECIAKQPLLREEQMKVFILVEAKQEPRRESEVSAATGSTIETADWVWNRQFDGSYEWVAFSGRCQIGCKRRRGRDREAK